MKRKYTKKLKAPYVPYTNSYISLLRCNCGIIYWDGFKSCPMCNKVVLSPNQFIDLKGF